MIENEKNVRPSDRKEPEGPKRQKLRVVPKKEPLPISQPVQTRKRVRRPFPYIFSSWREATRYNRVPRLLTAAKISRGAKWLAVMLLNFDLTQSGNETVWPSIELLMEATQVKTGNTITGWLRELEQANWIAKSKRKSKTGQSNEYHFLFPVITKIDELTDKYIVNGTNLTTEDLEPGWSDMFPPEKDILTRRFDLFFECVKEAKEMHRKDEIRLEKVIPIARKLFIDKGKQRNEVPLKN